MTTSILPAMLGNGRGLYFARCRDCLRTSPAIGQHDDLRVLAAAKAAAWSVRTAGIG